MNSTETKALDKTGIILMLLFLIPGIAITLSSIYFPISHLYKRIRWTQTEGVITGRADRPAGSEIGIFYLINYTDEIGGLHHVEVDSENFPDDPDTSQPVALLYDPADPKNFELVNVGRFLVVLFLPLGLLLIYFGWPRKD